jgi:hypothetical protein
MITCGMKRVLPFLMVLIPRFVCATSRIWSFSSQQALFHTLDRSYGPHHEPASKVWGVLSFNLPWFLSSDHPVLSEVSVVLGHLWVALSCLFWKRVVWTSALFGTGKANAAHPTIRHAVQLHAIILSHSHPNWFHYSNCIRCLYYKVPFYVISLIFCLLHLLKVQISNDHLGSKTALQLYWEEGEFCSTPRFPVKYESFWAKW